MHASQSVAKKFGSIADHESGTAIVRKKPPPWPCPRFATYHEGHAFIDGRGRTIATLSEADVDVDGYQWIVDGLTDYDNKGAERRRYLPWSWDGADPAQYPLSVAPATRYGQQRYDAFGRAVQTWRYAYNDAGDLIGTSDARGCGVNFAYDAAGRLVTEDYAPCESYQAPYSKYVPEVVYWYDFDDLTDAGQFASCPTNSTSGRLVSVTDRSGKSMTCYDQRGRTVEVARQLTDPSGNRAGRWYNRYAQYDAADRPTVESTGAGSEVLTSYTQRGTVKTVSSTYGTLVEGVKREPDGLVTEIKYGDGAHTTTSLTYDDLRRLHNQTTYRASFGPSNTLTTQMLLQDEEYVYDRVGNPVEIRDWRIADEWPSGSTPVTRKMGYDDLYRLVRMDYDYQEGLDPWTDPYAAEQDAALVLGNTKDRPMPRADFGSGHRVLQQSWQYDWLGNTATTDDDQHAFWDRSLGKVDNATPDEGAYKLESASNANGSLTTDYDAAGNLIVLREAVLRAAAAEVDLAGSAGGACAGAGGSEFVCVCSRAGACGCGPGGVEG